MSARSCELCGDTANVRVQLAWYRSEVAHRLGMPEVQTAARCMDHDACRARCLAQGDEWPLTVNDERWDRVQDAAARFVEPSPAVEPEPIQEPEPEEVTSWFS